MRATQEELTRALRGTSIEGSKLQQCWYAPGLPPAYGLEVSNDRILDAWAQMHALMPVTGHYPVIAPRCDFEILRTEEPDAVADAWLAASRHRSFEEGSEQVPPREDETGLFDWLLSSQERPGHPLGKTLRQFGAAPTNAEVLKLRERGVLQTDADLERWLLDWELERFGEQALVCMRPEYVNWFHPEPYEDYVLHLAPTAAMWEAAVYSDVRMLGERRGLATRCRDWHDRYGAELVASSSTMMQMTVTRGPADIDEAFDLALEQFHFSRDILILPDVSLREHARALLALDCWFFHWKP